MDELGGLLDSFRPFGEAAGIVASHGAIHYSLQNPDAINILNSYIACASDIAPYALGLVLAGEIGFLAKREFTNYMKQNGLLDQQ